MDKNSIIQYLIQQKINEEQNKSLNDDSSLGKIKQLTGNASSLGSNFSTTGNFLKDNVNSELAQKFGSNMANLGSNISNGANAVNDTLNAPGNYFKGYANRAVGQGLSKIGGSLAGKSGAIGKIGQSLASTGASMSGGAGAGAGTAAAGTTGATVGTGAAAGTAGAGTAAAGAGTAAGGAGGAAAGGAAGAGSAGGAAAGGAAAGSGALAATGIGALVALGIMGLTGTNRKRAKKGGEQLLNATNKMATSRQKNNLAAAQDNMKALQEQAQQNLANGIMTGGAASIQDANGVQSDFPMTKDAFAQSLYDNGWDKDTVNAALEGRNLGNKEMDDYIKYYNSVAPQDQQLVAPQSIENAAHTGNVSTNNEIKNGLLNKFLGGITDLTKGYDENRNTAFSPENLTQKQFANTTSGQSEVLTNYQNQLRDKGIDENIVNAVAQGKNSGNKDIANWINNNSEALKPVEQTTYTDKSKMARLGEALGTTSRFLNRPGVQGLIAGGLSTALTGGPLYGLGQGYKFANQRAMSDIYQNALREQGLEVAPGMFGALSSKDMTALMTPQYKQWENERMKAYYQAMADYRAGMLENAKKKTEIDEKYKNVKATNDTIKANASMIKAQKTGKKTGTSKTPKPQEHPDWGSDLAGYTKRLSNPRYATQLGNMKAAFIKKYGVDPDKYIKM